MTALAFSFARTADDLRPYQAEAYAAVDGALKTHRRVIVEMATGTGKTRLGSEIARLWPGRVWWVADRDELCDQAEEKLREVTGEPIGREQAERYSTDQRIVVVSAPTIIKERRRKNMPDTSLIIWDEVHRTISPTRRRLLDAYEGVRVVGLTATVTPRMGKVFNELPAPVFRYPPSRALREGWWCPIFWPPETKIDDLHLEKVGTKAGDLDVGELEKAIREEAVLHAYARKWWELASNRQTIAFMPGVESAKRFAEVLNDPRVGGKPGTAVVVLGETAGGERVRAIADYRAGRVKVLVNVGVAVEGLDVPETSCVIPRHTLVWWVYHQMCGRGTRPVKGKGGDGRLMILDFTSSSAKHKLVRPVTLLDGDWTEAEKSRAEKAMRDGKDLGDALEEARAVEKELAAHEAKVRHAARDYYRVDPVFVTRNAPNPLDALHVQDKEVLHDHHKVDARPVSPKMLAYLKRKGVPIPAVLTHRQAIKLQRTVMMREKFGLCSIRAVCKLQQYGYNAIKWKRAQAKEVLDTLARNGWRRVD